MAITSAGSTISANRGIAKITDTGSNILISCDLKSASSVTDAGGVLQGGTESFSDNGMDAGSAGSVSFTNFTGYTRLRHEGQICMTVSTMGICEYDDNGSTVSGSQAPNRTGMYLFESKNSGGTDMARILSFSTEQLRARLHSSDTEVGRKITTVGKGEYTELCLWWKGNQWGVMADGSDVLPAQTRAGYDDENFYQLIVGADNATTTPFDGYYIKDFVVSTTAPRFATKRNAMSIGLFGDSFVSDMADDDWSPVYDASGFDQIRRRLAAVGKRARIVVDGYSNYTVCDTGAQDLSDEITGFVATSPQVAIIVAGNNDIQLSSSDWATHALGTGGVEENLQNFINELYFSDYPTNTVVNPRLSKIYICQPGSLKQHTALDTAQAATNNTSYRAIVNGLPAWFDAANPTDAGLVEIVDLIEVLGDKTENYNFTGQWNLIGNATIAPGSLDNRHPHPTGQVVLINHIMNKVAGL